MSADGPCIAAPVNGIPFTFKKNSDGSFTLTISLWSGPFAITLTISGSSAHFVADFAATDHPPTAWAPCAPGTPPSGHIDGTINPTTGQGSGTIRLRFGDQTVNVNFTITGKG